MARYSQNLGFGGCRLCLQAPVTSSYKSGEDLSGKRIVTSFPYLAKKYFDQFDNADRITSKRVLQLYQTKKENSNLYISYRYQVRLRFRGGSLWIGTRRWCRRFS